MSCHLSSSSSFATCAFWLVRTFLKYHVQWTFLKRLMAENSPKSITWHSIQKFRLNALCETYHCHFILSSWFSDARMASCRIKHVINEADQILSIFLPIIIRCNFSSKRFYSKILTYFLTIAKLRFANFRSYNRKWWRHGFSCESSRGAAAEKFVNLVKRVLWKKYY